MKKTVLAITLSFLAAQAQADVFSDYQAVGTKALEMAKNPESRSEDVVTELKTLVSLGYQIIDLYLVKYPVCTEQYNQLKAVDSTILTLSYAEIDELYHEGKGLPQGPGSCYRGRSMVVHPYQIAALALAGELQNDLGTVDHELTEVIERADKIKQDLGL